MARLLEPEKGKGEMDINIKDGEGSKPQESKRQGIKRQGVKPKGVAQISPGPWSERKASGSGFWRQFLTG